LFHGGERFGLKSVVCIVLGDNHHGDDVVSDTVTDLVRIRLFYSLTYLFDIVCMRHMLPLLVCSYRNSVRLSVSLFVCHTSGQHRNSSRLWQRRPT